jgi:heptaprenyl diphosphate synthase
VDARLIITSSEGNSEIATSCLRMISVGGKRLRPALAIATAGLGDIFDHRVVAAAAAVELVQVGSLVHDDIFDEALTRRGTPTINAVEGNNEALFAGTYLLALAASEAASAGKEVAGEVARTVAELSVGQAKETQHLFDTKQGVDQYLSNINGKTAALFACSCRVGALCAGLPLDVVKQLGDFGRNFGMAFQILDDVLDLIADPDLLGKPVGSDIPSGVLTMPVLLELEGHNGGDMRMLLNRRTPADLEQAKRMVIKSGRIEEATDLARKYADAAAAAIGSVSMDTRALSLFAGHYLEWALEQFVAV